MCAFAKIADILPPTCILPSSYPYPYRRNLLLLLNTLPQIRNQEFRTDKSPRGPKIRYPQNLSKGEEEEERGYRIHISLILHFWPSPSNPIPPLSYPIRNEKERQIESMKV